jgi:hypothetical protein
MGKFSEGLDLAGKVIGTAGDIGGLITGAIQSRKAKKLYGEADKLIPPYEDPEQRSLLEQIQRKASMIEKGVDPVTAYGKQMIGSSLATTQGNVVRGSAGNAGTLLEGLRRSSVDAGRATNELYANIYPQSTYYTGLGYQLANKIAQRKFDIRMSLRLQKLREAAEMRQASNANISGGLGMLLPT